MKKFIQKSILTIFCLFFITCKKEIKEPEHKNTGCNIAYVEFDGHKYLFEKKGITFYKNIKAKFKSGIDNSSGLKPFLDLNGDRFNFQGVIIRTDRFEKKKGNNNNQVDLIDFNITAYKEPTSGKWICDTTSWFSFLYVSSYKPYSAIDYEVFGYRSPPFASYININVLKIDNANKIFSMIIKADAYNRKDLISKPIYIYFDIEIQ